MYERRVSFGGILTKTILSIIIINSIFFLLQLTIKDFTGLLALNTKNVFPYRIYTIFTYSLLHGSLSHLFFNMLSLYFFGGSLQKFIGTKRFLIIYIFSALTGGIFSLFFTKGFWVIGASASVLGVLTSYAIYFPHTTVYLFFVIPMPIRHILYLLMALSIFFSLFGGGGNIAHLAHLGGIVFAIFYCNKWWKLNLLYNDLKYRIKRRKFKVIK